MQTEPEIKDHTLPSGYARGSFGKPVRWSIEQASIEFSIDNKTLAQRLRRGGVMPGKDKKYSTAQICAQVYGDAKLEQLRGFEKDNALKDIDLAKARNEVVPMDGVFQTMSNMLFSIRRLILMSPLPKETQDGILKELEGLKASDFVTEAVNGKERI